MELDPKEMQKIAWDLFDLNNKLIYAGYHLTTDRARNKGEYKITEIAARDDYNALRKDTNEFDDVTFHNALYSVAEIRNVYRKLSERLDWWEAQLVKASGREPIKIA